jgi:hypothetical protein
MRGRGLIGAGIASMAAAAAFAPPAFPSQVIGADAKNVKLVADGSGRALVTFTSGGSAHSVLASGAVNARAPSRAVPQVQFQIDNRGGSVTNTCRPVRLLLAWLVTACRASDGSYWALQSWQRLLPNGGAKPAPAQAVRELRLSHWTGETARLTVRFGWSFRRYLQLYGLYRYQGGPIYGYRVRNGVPLDGYGRNIYVDAFNSDVGRGWQRVNSFLSHGPLGAFCYGFFPHPGGTGMSGRLRASAIGPGVTPDVMWQGNAPTRYSSADDEAGDTGLLSLLRGDRLCRPN